MLRVIVNRNPDVGSYARYIFGHGRDDTLMLIKSGRLARPRWTEHQNALLGWRQDRPADAGAQIEGRSGRRQTGLPVDQRIGGYGNPSFPDAANGAGGSRPGDPTAYLTRVIRYRATINNTSKL